MNNMLALGANFVFIAILIALLAAAIGYFWASSRAKSALLKQAQDAGQP